MRISDWSSDVCSSDLVRRGLEDAGIGVPGAGEDDVRAALHLAAGQLAGGEGVVERGRRRPDEVDDQLRGRVGETGALVEAADKFPDQRDVHGAAEKIGRASCRERVCPYV